MNRTRIDWADMTWNPVTGCLHGCPYCYARREVNRFAGHFKKTEKRIHSLDAPEYKEIEHYDNGCASIMASLTPPEVELRRIPWPFGFEPTFHRYRLEEPQLRKKPENVFVCSMADLFGEWVPDEWIEKVFDVCNGAPQHRFLFLTKNPKRYEQYIDRYMPKNMWFGWTQTKPCGLEFKTHHAWQTFLSLEPIQAEFPFPNPQFDWLIIGMETGNRKCKVIPKKEWIEAIVNECRKNNIPVFLKNNLTPVWGDSLIQEYPWEKG